MRRTTTSAVRIPVAVAALTLAATACGSEGTRALAPADHAQAVDVELKAPSATPVPPAQPVPPAEKLAAPRRTVAPQVAPLNGSTVGVGQPLALVFKAQKVDASLRAGIEGALKVTTSTPLTGAWHWAESQGDTLLHFRPEHYWPAHTKITLDARLSHVKLTDGTAVDRDRKLSFTTGDSMVNKVDLAAHTMTVVRNGDVARVIPVSGGEERFKTREGVKTVLAKDGRVIMDSRTIGIPRDSPDGYYDPYDWSMRETISGEYLHAAPDNAASFGKENVSHGCIGMSDANAKWLYGLSRVGDVIEVTGTTGKPMDHFGNGYGDWNLTWADWLAGSELGERPTR
ncbi:L,D-transpeptidase [Streptomyces sp. NBC_00237]|uniref:L,D-transpeptidase n=1 Tax=Streptomyces sp. NBC_00237 TaxID=2975687 RepID=UPI00225511A2|nr:L,D-transpeptidase [Streptomyces sp. NBC_00237]MCX5203359.1 L,D-transpeptidase [Streptomyces sp. NBC_00237]